MRINRTKLMTCLVGLLLVVQSVCETVMAQNLRQPTTTTEGIEFYTTWMVNNEVSNLAEVRFVLTSKYPASIVLVNYSGGVTPFSLWSETTKSYVDASRVTLTPGKESVLKLKNNSVLNTSGLVQNQGYIIRSSDYPFSVTLVQGYDDGHKNGSAMDATVVLPVEALGREYVIQTNNNDTKGTEFIIEATKDDTKITIQLSDTAAGAALRDWHNPYSTTLKGRQVFFVSSVGNQSGMYSDLSGTTICSDKPIAVFQGNKAASIPNILQYSTGYLLEQALPVDKWGTEFIVPMTQNNTLHNVLNITAYKDSKVNIGGKQVTIEANSTYRMDLYSTEYRNKPVYVKSDNPVQVLLYTTSGFDNKVGENLIGTPSSTTITPLIHLADSVTFSSVHFTRLNDSVPLDHTLMLWAKGSEINKIKVDDQVPTGWKDVVGTSVYKWLTMPLKAGPHKIFAEKKCFGGYTYGIADGLSYMHSLGFDFVPKPDSLLLRDPAKSYEGMMEKAPLSEYVTRNNTGYWYLNDNYGQYAARTRDKITTCADKEGKGPTMTFDAVANSKTSKDPVKWEIRTAKDDKTLPYKVIAEGTGTSFTYQFQMQHTAEEARALYGPGDAHRLYEDFTVNMIIPRDKMLENSFEFADTLSAVMHLQRTFNDTVWAAIYADGEDGFLFAETATGKPKGLPVYYTAGEDGQEKVINGVKAVTRHVEPGNHKFDLVAATNLGCDSLVCLHLLVCNDEEKTLPRRTVCQEDLPKLVIPEFEGRTFGDLPLGEQTLYHEKDGYCCAGENVLKEYLKHKNEMQYSRDYWETGFNGYKTKYFVDVNVIEVKYVNTSDVWCETSKDQGYTWRWNPDDQSKVRTIQWSEFGEATQKVFEERVKYTNSDCAECTSCDKVVYRLTLTKAENQTMDVPLCEGDVFTYSYKDASGQTEFVWPGDKGDHVETLQVSSQDGECTFDLTLNIKVTKTEHLEPEEAEICQKFGRTYTWAGRNGYVWDLTDANHPKRVMYNNISREVPGEFMFVDTTKSSTTGCDVVNTLHLVINPMYNENKSIVLSNWDSISANGKWYYGEDLYKEKINAGIIQKGDTNYVEIHRDPQTNKVVPATLTHRGLTADGCDSIVNYTIRYDKIWRNDKAINAVCADCEFVWHTLAGSAKEGTEEDVVVFIPAINDVLRKEGKPILTEDTTIIYEKRYKRADVPVDSIYSIRLTHIPVFVGGDEIQYLCQGDTEQEVVWPYADPTRKPNLWVYDGEEDKTGHELKALNELSRNIAGTFIVKDKQTADRTIKTADSEGRPLERLLQCDSVWQFTVQINPVYNTHFNYTSVLTRAEVNSWDTISWNHRLYVGVDFQGSIPSGYEKVVKLTADDYHGLHLYRDSVLGNQTSFACDSIVYLELDLYRDYQSRTLHLGDNDHLKWATRETPWSFGGAKEDLHTYPLVNMGNLLRDSCHLSVDAAYYSNTNWTQRENALGKMPIVLTDTLTILRTVNGQQRETKRLVVDSIFIHPTYLLEEPAMKVCSADDEASWRCYDQLNTLPLHNDHDSVYCNYPTRINQVDSIYVMDLKIVPNNVQTWNVVRCEGDVYTWEYNNASYTYQGNEWTHEELIRPNSEGCDSRYILNLHWAKKFEQVESKDVCQFEDFVWLDKDGNPHTEGLCLDGQTGIIDRIPTDKEGLIILHDSLKNIGGCDSVYTLRLTVRKRAWVRYPYTLCSNEKILWNDSVYRYNGEPYTCDTIRFESLTGNCDSIESLQIRWHVAYNETLVETLCASDKEAVEAFEWGGELNVAELLEQSKTWDAPRVFEDEVLGNTEDYGCDSIVHLKLTILPCKDSVWTETICYGEQFMMEDQVLTEPGIYESYVTNQYGCTVPAKLDLRVLFATDIYLEEVHACVEHYKPTMENRYNISATYLGYRPNSYSIHYSDEAKSLGLEDIIDDSFDEPRKSLITYRDTVIDGGPQGNFTISPKLPRVADEYSYPKPGTYKATISFNNGICRTDSVMTHDFDIDLRYPWWIIEPVFGGEMLVVHLDYAQDKPFERFKWYENGKQIPDAIDSYLGGADPNSHYQVAIALEGEDEFILSCYEGESKLTSINHLGDGAWRVMPTAVSHSNPTVMLHSELAGEYMLYTTYGALVTRGQMSAGDQQLTIPAQSGVYVLYLRGQSGLVSAIKITVF